jgi:hypothetical protein
VLLVIAALLFAVLLGAGAMPTGSGAPHTGADGHRSIGATTRRASGPGDCATSARCTPVGPQRTPAPPQQAFGIGFIALGATLLSLARRRLGAGAERRLPPLAVGSIFHPPDRALTPAA